MQTITLNFKDVEIEVEFEVEQSNYGDIDHVEIFAIYLDGSEQNIISLLEIDLDDIIQMTSEQIKPYYEI
ncbi:hypothetical protein UFOVP104_24 [uncultured Caudovirales phage]|uniref:Uncharacterized protein n=1 Tax=uncultured Caudovirales phage TaxID=2100421 RepID=A0A6J5L3C1_9CAUD|nr:hypothetical protein UFOVP104_24 [uncultured Caudovirales phage]CAB4134002.1 hypothetical protein UFOVP271_4 [uncultured Caudovirales phage]